MPDSKQAPPRLPATRAWKRRARAEMELQGITLSALAKMIGVSKGSLSQLLSETGKTPQTSRLVGPVSQRLGMPTPEYRDESEAQVSRYLRLVRRYAPSAYAAHEKQLAREVERILREHPDATDEDTN